MFCPSCGQQQAPGEVRFCPRCGFPQYGVMALLNTNGQWPETGTGETTVSPRKRGVKQGALMLFIGVILVPLLAILADGTGFPEELAAAAAVICFMGGPLRMLYAAIFEEGQKTAPPAFSAATPATPAYVPPGQPLFAPPPPTALPPMQQNPIPTNAWRPTHNTQEMNPAPPHSVTEHTTRIFNRDTE